MSKFEDQFSNKLDENNITFIKNDRSMYGTPDFSFSNKRTVLFLHGCFWHGHNCRAWNLNTAWKSRISCNIQRDIEVRRFYQSTSIRFLMCWECQYMKNQDHYAEKIINEIRKPQFHS